MTNIQAEWLNTRDLYIQYTDISQIHPLILKALQKFGFLFDDSFWYWITRNGRYVRKAPLWCSKCGAMAEKHRGLK